MYLSTCLIIFSNSRRQEFPSNIPYLGSLKITSKTHKILKALKKSTADIFIILPTRRIIQKGRTTWSQRWPINVGLKIWHRTPWLTLSVMVEKENGWWKIKTKFAVDEFCGRFTGLFCQSRSFSITGLVIFLFCLYFLWSTSKYSSVMEAN